LNTGIFEAAYTAIAARVFGSPREQMTAMVERIEANSSRICMEEIEDGDFDAQTELMMYVDKVQSAEIRLPDASAQLLSLMRDILRIQEVSELHNWSIDDARMGDLMDSVMGRFDNLARQNGIGAPCTIDDGGSVVDTIFALRVRA